MYAFMFGLNITSYETQGPISFCGHILYMLVPVQVMADFQLLWSHFVYVGSSSGHGRFPVQGTLHGLLPPELGHVENTGFGGDSGPE